MRSFVLAGILLGLLAGAAIVTALAETSPPDIEWMRFDWDDLQRTYGIYVPVGALDPAPLVFLLHGGGGSARKTWTQEHGRSWRALAVRVGSDTAPRVDWDDPEIRHLSG